MAGSVSRSERVPVTEDEEAAALAAVHDMLGPDQQLVSVEKNVVVREEEVLLVNGTPITLEGEEGQAIKVILISDWLIQIILISDWLTPNISHL